MLTGYGKLFSEPNIHPESVVLPKAVRDKANNHETILSVEDKILIKLKFISKFHEETLEKNQLFLGVHHAKRGR